MEENHHSTNGHPVDHKAHNEKLPAYSNIPGLENWLGEILGNLPNLPLIWRENIAKYGPWATLIILLLALPGVLAVFGLSTYVFSVASRAGYYHRSGFDIFILILVIASLIFEALALPGLFKRLKQGWVFIFYASLIAIVSNVLSFNFGSLLGSAISLYIIFQIKSQYK